MFEEEEQHRGCSTSSWAPPLVGEVYAGLMEKLINRRHLETGAKVCDNNTADWQKELKLDVKWNERYVWDSLDNQALDNQTRWSSLPSPVTLATASLGEGILPVTWTTLPASSSRCGSISPSSLLLLIRSAAMHLSSLGLSSSASAS